MIKKYLITIIILILGLTNVSITQAKTNYKVSTDFFKSFDNLLKLNSYQTTQNLSGSFSVNNELKIYGDYKITFKNNIHQKDRLMTRANSKIIGHINIKMDGEDREFDNLVLNFRGDILITDKKDLFVRLQNIDLLAKGIPTETIEDYRTFQKEMAKYIQPIKGQWISIPNTFYDNYSTELNNFKNTETFNEDEIQKSLIKNGVKNTALNYIDTAIGSAEANGLFTKKDTNKIKEIINNFYSTKFFKYKNLNKGPQKGSTSYVLDKTKILTFIKQTVNLADEHISTNELMLIKKYLRKIAFYGTFHKDVINKIIDKFEINFAIRNIEELKHFQISYKYKINNLNSASRIRTPRKHISIDSLIDPSLLQIGF